MGAFLKKHYHWIIAAVAMVQLFVVGGINNNLSGLFIDPVTTSLDISRGSFSLAVSMRSMMGFCSSMVFGFLLKKLGYKRGACIFIGCSVLAMFLLSQSGSVWVIGLASALHGLSDSFCNTTGASYIVGKWFHKHKGTVMGIVMAATGLGGSVMSIGLNKVMESSGWQGAYRLCGILFLALLLMIILLCRDDPAKMGRNPYGMGEITQKKKKPKEIWEGYALGDLFRKPVFYMMMVAVFLSCICIFFPFYTVVPHLQACGISRQDAVLMNSVLMIALAAVKLASGVFSDLVGAKRVAIFCLVVQVASLLVMAYVDNLITALIGVLLVALALPISTILIPLLTTTLFGYRAQNTYVGMFVALSSLAAMVASPVINAVFDVQKTYKYMYLLAAVVTVGLICMFLVIYLICAKEKKKMQEQYIG